MVAGFIYLLLGGDLLVRGAVALARRTRVSPVVIALCVVGLGTSLPELVVSIRASITGYPGLALGNVVGSNIANVLLVGGVAAVIFPLRSRDQGVRHSGTAMLAISLLFAGLCVWGREVTRLDGAILLGVFVVAFGLIFRTAMKALRDTGPDTPLDWVLGLPHQLRMIALLISIGLVVLPLGADFLVDAAVQIASRYGVSDTVVGLSIVAIGTSLPEVATTVMAALRGKTGMVVGTIVGSNVFNVLAIMGVAAALSPEPVQVSGRLLVLDLPVMIAASLILVSFSWRGVPIRRWAGISFGIGYALYMMALFLVA